MSLITLNHDTLEEAVDTNDMLVIDIWASWCGPCKRFAPVYEEVAEETEGVTFAKFQTDASDENQEAFESMGFQAVPTILFFKGGNLLAVNPGALPKAEFRNIVAKLKDFDLKDLKDAQKAE